MLVHRQRITIKHLQDLIRLDTELTNHCLVLNPETGDIIVLPPGIADQKDIIVRLEEVYDLAGESQAWEMSMPLEFSTDKLREIAALLNSAETTEDEL